MLCHLIDIYQFVGQIEQMFRSDRREPGKHAGSVHFWIRGGV